MSHIQSRAVYRIAAHQEGDRFTTRASNQIKQQENAEKNKCGADRLEEKLKPSIGDAGPEPSLWYGFSRILQAHSYRILAVTRPTGQGKGTGNLYPSQHILLVYLVMVWSGGESLDTFSNYTRLQGTSVADYWQVPSPPFYLGVKPDELYCTSKYKDIEAHR